MHEKNENFHKEKKYSEVPDTSFRIEEYSNCTEKFSRGVQQQARSNRRKDQKTQSQGSGWNSSNQRGKKIKCKDSVVYGTLLK